VSSPPRNGRRPASPSRRWLRPHWSRQLTAVVHQAPGPVGAGTSCASHNSNLQSVGCGSESHGRATTSLQRAPPGNLLARSIQLGTVVAPSLP
jgi:hypothetical protein